MRYPRLVVWCLVLVVTALVGVGCGDDDDGEDEDTAAAETATTETGAAAGAVEINMGDFFFDPKDASASAGSVTISAPNVGQVVHELVLFKSDADPGSLPVKGGEVDEEALEEEGAEEAGEIEDVEAGQTKDGTFDLTPGKYAMFCNIPGHYEKGMYGSFTVK